MSSDDEVNPANALAQDERVLDHAQGTNSNNANLNANGANNINGIHNADNKLQMQENDRISMEQNAFKLKESQMVSQVKRIIEKLKPCNDRFVYFYSLFKQSEVCLYKISKFTISFKVIEELIPNPQMSSVIGSQDNPIITSGSVLFKPKEYLLSLWLDVEVLNYNSQKLLFQLRRNDIDFLESIISQAMHLISRWGFADFIITQYFRMNPALLAQWERFNANPNSMNQLIMSFDKKTGSFQGQYQLQENIELMNVGFKLQFLASHYLTPIRTITGITLRMTQRYSSSSTQKISLSENQQPLHQMEVDKNTLGAESVIHVQNYQRIKRFLRIRSGIVKKTFTTLQHISPQLICKLGLQKRKKNEDGSGGGGASTSEGVHNGDEFSQENMYESEFAWQYEEVKNYVQFYRKLHFETIRSFERYLHDNQPINSASSAQANFSSKQQELLLSKSPIQSIKSKNPINIPIPITSSIAPGNKRSSVLVVQNSSNNIPFNAIQGMYGQPIQQSSMSSRHNSSSSINDISKHALSRGEIIVQSNSESKGGALDQEGGDTYFGLNDVMIASDDSSRSRLSLARNKKTRNSGEFAPVPALTSKEVSSIAMSRSDSKRRESQTKGSQQQQEEDNRLFGMGPANGGSNLQIERFHKRTHNKKSTFSMAKKVLDTSSQNQLDNSSLGVGRSPSHHDVSQEVIRMKENQLRKQLHQRMSEVDSSDQNFQILNRSSYSISRTGNNNTKGQMYQIPGSERKLFSLDQSVDQLPLSHPNVQIKEFKQSLNISVSSDNQSEEELNSSNNDNSGDYDMNNKDNEDNFRSFQLHRQSKQNKKKKIFDHSLSSADNSQPYSVLYPSQQFRNSAQGSYDFKKASPDLYQQFIDEERNENAYSPRSFDEDGIAEKSDPNKLTRKHRQSYGISSSGQSGRQSIHLENKRIDQNDSSGQDEKSDKIKKVDSDDQLLSKQFQGQSIIPQSGSDQTDKSFLGAQKNLTFEDWVAYKLKQFQEILICQDRSKFFEPLKCIQYFEENRNKADIFIPDILLNPFQPRQMLYSGIVRLSTQKGNDTLLQKKSTIGDKGILSLNILEQQEEEEEEMESNHNFYQYNVKQQQQQPSSARILSTESNLAFVTIRICYSEKAKQLWNKELLLSEEDVKFEVEVTKRSSNQNKLIHKEFTFSEFISVLFPEHIGSKQRSDQLSSQKSSKELKELPQSAAILLNNSESRSQQSSSQTITQNEITLHEEDFGLNRVELQWEQLSEFIDIPITYEKDFCTSEFQLPKFLYRMGFSSEQKKLLHSRLQEQLVLVNNSELQLKSRSIKKFRLLIDELVFVEDEVYEKALTMSEFQSKQLPKRMSNLAFNLPGVSSDSNQMISTNQMQNNPATTYQMSNTEILAIGQPSSPKGLTKKSISTSKFLQSMIIKENTVNEIQKKINSQGEGNNNVGGDNDFNEVRQRNSDVDKLTIQSVIFTQQIQSLFDIVIKQSIESHNQYEVLVQFKNQPEKQLEFGSQIAGIQTEKLNLFPTISQITGPDTFPLQEQLQIEKKKSKLHLSLTRTTQSELFASNQQELQKSLRPRPSIITSVNAQKWTRKLKNAIKSVLNHVNEVPEEERERNYSDGRINHALAMNYYNTILHIKQRQNSSVHLSSRKEDLKRVDARESIRKPEDFHIINLQSNNDGFRKHLKIEFKIEQSLEGDLYADLTFYDPLSYRFEKVRVRETKNLEKLQNLIQVSNTYSTQGKLRELLMKINLRWGRKIIGRKLEFSSFIETNQDFFKYKLSRKMNANDEALYKLMTTKNYLEENIKQYTNFLYKVKLALISNDQNARTSEQNYFFNTYFYSTRVQQFQNIQNLGRALIQTTVFQSKQLYTLTNQIFIRIDISPATKRTKSIKMILDFNDIITILTETEYNQTNCLDPESICTMIKAFAMKLVYSHSQNYNALKIPFWKQFNQISESSDYDLTNQFDFNSMNTKQEISFLSKKSMLTPVLRTFKIIYQGIKKIDNQFLVITVKRYIYLTIDWFQLIIYIPKTSRRFTCYLMESDLLKLDSSFMESIVPLVIVKHEQNISDLKLQKTYLQFCEAFDELHRSLQSQENQDSSRKASKKPTYRSEGWFQKGDSNKFIQLNQKSSVFYARKPLSKQSSQRSISSQMNSFNGNAGESSLNSSNASSFTRTKYQTQSVNFVKYFQKNLTEQTSFLEKKVWEHIIASVVIEENKQHKLILQINTFKGILRESLASMVLNLNERDNILYEFYLEDMDKTKKHSIFLESSPIKLEEAFYKNLYVRINFFGQEFVHNEKICGRHMLYSYHKMAMSKLKNKRVELANQLLKGLSSSKSLVPAAEVPPPLQIQGLSQASKQSLSQLVEDPKENKKKNRPSLLGRTSIDKTGALNKGVTLMLSNGNNGVPGDDPFLYQFILADLQEMAIFYANKIKANYNEFVKQREMKSLQHDISEYLSLYKSKSLQKDSKCERIVKPNSKFKDEINLSRGNAKYHLIHRRILTISPRQMLTIFYQPKRKLFIFFAWNNENSKEVILRKQLSEVEEFIPHAIQLFKSKLIKELGNRIFLAYKNQVLLQTVAIASNH